MNNYMETVKINIGILDNLVNLMAHILNKFIQEIKQGNHLVPVNFQSTTNDDNEVTTDFITSTKIIDDTSLGDPLK